MTRETSERTAAETRDERAAALRRLRSRSPHNVLRLPSLYKNIYPTPLKTRPAHLTFSSSSVKLPGSAIYESFFSCGRKSGGKKAAAMT